MPNAQPASNRDVSYTGAGPPGQNYGYGDSLMPFGQLQLPFRMPMGMPGMMPGMGGVGFPPAAPLPPAPRGPWGSVVAPPLDAQFMPGFQQGPPGPPVPPPRSMAPSIPPASAPGWIPGQYGVPPDPWSNETPPPIPMGP